MKKFQLWLAVITVLVLLVTSCGGAAPTTAPKAEAPKAEATEAPKAEAPKAEATEAPMAEATEAPMAEQPAPSAYKEAPMLADMVAAGTLPPVEERLPAEPVVVDVVENIGTYGGTWNAVTGDQQGMGNIKMKLYDPPVRWKPDYSGYEPGLAKSYEWSEDGKTITFKFREGVKWSDGEPFTTADLKFWWEDLAQNEDIKTVNVPWWAHNSDGSNITMEFPDDYTWVLKFDKAQWIMPYVLAQGFWEWEPLMKPAHFLKQWHPKYTPSAKFEDYDLNDRWHQTAGYPCLMAWCLKEYTPSVGWVWERNPYYWKVDPEGNQLPYIDQLKVEIVVEQETRNLKIAQGAYDCTFRGGEDPTTIPFLNEQADAGNFHIVTGWWNGAGAWPGWIINMDYHEEQEYDAATETPLSKETRELIRTKEFRKGLSHALDRQRILDVIWEGIGTVQNFTISPQSIHFKTPAGQEMFQKWANADIEFDPEMAKSLFDSINFKDQNGDGWRDLPSGLDFTLVIDQGDWGGKRVTTESNEAFRAMLEAVNIKVLINDVIGQPGTRGDYGFGWVLRNTHASEIDLWTYPDWLFPLRGGGEGSRAFPVEGRYYQTGGKEGWKPEPGSPAEKLQNIYKQGLEEPDFDKRNELILQAVQVYIDEGPFVLGAAGDQPMPVVCKNYFHNVPDEDNGSYVLGPWAPGSPGNIHPEQFYMDPH
jgi:peptide/nickel transport system substrate-binding protein